MESKEFTAGLIQTLKSARQERAKVQAEIVTLENLIAGLELALDGAAPANPETIVAKKRPAFAPASPPARLKVNSGHRFPINKAQTDSATVQCLTHYDGKAVTTSQVGKFLARHRPQNLLRKHISELAWYNRALDSLKRLEQGRVQREQAGGRTLNWSFAGKGA